MCLVSGTVGHLFAHKAQIDSRFHSAQRMIGSHPLLQVYRIIKELRLALPLSHHDGNTLLAHLPSLGTFFFPVRPIWATRPKSLRFAGGLAQSSVPDHGFFAGTGFELFIISDSGVSVAGFPLKMMRLGF